jgi:hypothetical protein
MQRLALPPDSSFSLTAPPDRRETIMKTFMPRVLASLILVGGLGGVAFSEDPKSSQSETPKSVPADKPQKPDFSGYTFHSLITAEVVKADENKVTLRVFWAHVESKGSRGGRPSLHSGRSHHSPFAVRRPNVKIKWEHHDYAVPYVLDSLVRTKTLPPKFDSDGKRGFYSAKEQADLSAPIGVPGFQAAKGDLVPGTIIEAHLIRDKSIPQAKATDADVRIKYAVILRHDPNPPKDIAQPTPAKKN